MGVDDYHARLALTWSHLRAQNPEYVRPAKGEFLSSMQSPFSSSDLGHKENVFRQQKSGPGSRVRW